jgi:23S rRNA (guanine2445-N2)-methyltransferase / 23S rRNA (guanine2069-N7)-methyltransferase
LYRSIPEVLARLPTWSHYFLTAYPNFESVMGRQADRRRKLYNGRIECTYYQFHGPKPVIDRRPSAGESTAVPAVSDGGAERQASGSPIREGPTYIHAQGPAAFGQLDEKAEHQSELFAARLTKRAKHLRRWPTRRGVSCYRIYERDIPEIPLVVDRYEDHLHITEYERPHDRDPAQHVNWLERMARTAGETLGVGSRNVHLKRRIRQLGSRQHQRVARTDQRIEVSEGGLKFWVNLNDYVDTGLFLDHRVTRQMVRDAAAGATFLNLFAYTGAFTVYAAAGGAARTVSVDLSSSYLDWAADNLRLNGLDGASHERVVGDIGPFLRRHPSEPTYDLVVVDPPTFSNSKRTDEDWNLQRDAVPLLSDLLPLVRPGGVIFFSCNFRRFKFDPSPLDVREVHEISRQTVPEDFRNRRIHRCWRIVR